MKYIIIILLTIITLSSYSQSNDSIDIFDTTVYSIVEINPKFPEGEAKLFEYLGKNIKFKNNYTCENRGCKRILIQFVVEKNGSVSNVEIIKGNLSMDSLNIEMMSKMPKWKPGILRDKYVRVKFILPIRIRLR